MPPSHLLSSRDRRLGDASAPGPLPAAWSTAASFPALKTLVLLPGNEATCTPGEEGSYAPLVGGSAGFLVIDVFFNSRTDFLPCPSA